MLQTFINLKREKIIKDIGLEIHRNSKIGGNAMQSNITYKLANK